jgi:tubulin-specific chaperone A
MDNLSTIIKQLSINVKACQRLSNEADYYKREAKENEIKLAKMRSDGRDPYDIKKFEEVLDESYMMIPDSEERFRRSIVVLRSFLTQHSLILEQSSSEWKELANQILLKQSQDDSKGETATSQSIPDVAVTNVNDLMEGEVF